MAFVEIRDFLDLHTSRLRSLQERGTDHATTREALAELTMALEALTMAREALRVSDEELQAQREMLRGVREALEEERSRGPDLLDQLPEPCVVTDVRGGVRRANAPAAALLGALPGTLVGHPLAGFVGEGDLRAFLKRLARGFNAGQAVELELDVAAGARVRARVGAARDGEARPVLVWLLREVAAPAPVPTDDVALLQAMLDALPDPSCALDLDGTLLRWNRAAADALGLTPQRAGGACPVRFPAGETYTLLRTPDRVDGVLAEVERAGGQTVRLRASVAPLISGATRLGTLLTFAPEPAEYRPAERDDPDAILARCRAVLTAETGGGVYERLRTWIASGLHLGHLHPGSRLPSIRQVVDASGAEHRAVASAYRTLAAEGLVEVRNRQGAFVAGAWEPVAPELNETAEWLAGVLEGASGLRIRVPQLADVVSRWTTTSRVRCACMESVEDERAALVAEMAGQWGMEAVPVPPSSPRGAPDALHGAELIVTTAFHATEAHAAGRTLGVPVLVLAAGAEMVQAAEERLAQGPLTAVVADPAYAERLRFLRGAERLRVVLADDAAALASLPAGESVLLTPAARQRLGSDAPRMLVPLPSFVSRTPARTIAAFLIQHNLAPARRRM